MKLRTFVKYKNFWWEYEGDSPIDNARLYNVYGGYACNVDIRDRETVQANNFKELDWSGTDVLNKNSKYGWVDRNGVFYGCDYTCHELQAYLVHNSSKEELERAGWIHISSPSKYLSRRLSSVSTTFSIISACNCSAFAFNSAGISVISISFPRSSL